MLGNASSEGQRRRLAEIDDKIKGATVIGVRVNGDTEWVDIKTNDGKVVALIANGCRADCPFFSLSDK